jgi:hypothetical protein
MLGIGADAAEAGHESEDTYACGHASDVVHVDFEVSKAGEIPMAAAGQQECRRGAIAGVRDADPESAGQVVDRRTFGAELRRIDGVLKIEENGRLGRLAGDGSQRSARLLPSED